MKHQKQCVERNESVEVSTVVGRRPERDTDRLFFTSAVTVGRLWHLDPAPFHWSTIPAMIPAN